MLCFGGECFEELFDECVSFFACDVFELWVDYDDSDGCVVVAFYFYGIEVLSEGFFDCACFFGLVHVFLLVVSVRGDWCFVNLTVLGYRGW